MGVPSNEIIVAGQRFPLGSNIVVFNFRDNPDYSFIEDGGGACGAMPQASGPPPSIVGLNIPVGSEQEPGSSGRAYQFRRGIRNPPGPDTERNLEQLAGTLETVVIHHDAAYHAHGCFCILKTRGLSTHFIINHDGGVIQGIDPWYVAYHNRDWNMGSIGIDMNNIATVEGRQSRYSDPLFGSVANYEDRQVVEGRINRSLKQSFAYTDQQYETLVAIMRILGEFLRVPMLFPQSEDGGGVITSTLRNPGSFRGFWGHYHNTPTKWDPGPGFDWEKVMEGLHGKRNFWPIDLGTTPLGSINTDAEVRTSTREFYRNTEENNEGGNYPLGLNQEWHNGVHLHAPKGTPVRAVAEGKIVLVRNGPNLPLGSPNFVLIQHDMVKKQIALQPDGTVLLEDIPIRWYSLYMHLERMDHRQVPLQQTEGGSSAAPMEGESEQRELPSWYVSIVQLARERKGRPLTPRDDYGSQDVLINPEAFHARVLGLLRLPGVSHVFESIEDGNTYRLQLDPDGSAVVPVRGGELIGYVGEYGELVGQQVNKRPMLHFEIFSRRPIFDDTMFGTSEWMRVQADSSGNSLVSIPDVILPMRGGGTSATRAELMEGVSNIELTRGRILTPSEIEAFYRSAPESMRALYRRMITSHLSEWDIAIDDSVTAGVSILWPWQTDQEFLFWRAHHVGFKWLTNDTRDLLGMTGGAERIFTYHPIYLLGWWATNFGRSIHGQAFEALAGEDLMEAFEVESAREPDPETLARGDAVTLRIDELDGFQLEYDEFLQIDNGEWPDSMRIRSPFEG